VLTRELLERLGLGDISGIQSPPGGSSTPTAIVGLDSGERVVVQAFAQPRVVEVLVRANRVLAAAHVPVAAILAVRELDAQAFVVSAFVPGVAGSAHIDRASGDALASEMGRLGALIRSVDPADVGRSRAWTDGRSLGNAMRAWTRNLRDAELERGVEASAEAVCELPWTPTLSHGDYVPINALVARGSVTALLDLGDAAVRHPLLDAAWWALIVRHHHAGASARLIEHFLAAAGTTEDQERRLLPALALLRCAELLSAAEGFAAPHLRTLAATASEWAAATDRRPRGREGG
jgi:aminoglycoside phosphotransferase (APT) family kinase protein